MADDFAEGGIRREDRQPAPAPQPRAPRRPALTPKSTREALQAKMEEAFRAQAEQEPDQAFRSLAATSLGIPEAIVPAFETMLGMQAWYTAALGFSGKIDAIREYTERIWPKPKRLEVTRPPRDAIPVGGRTDEERKAAEDYFAALDEIALGDDNDGMMQ